MVGGSVDSGCHKLSENIWFVWSGTGWDGIDYGSKMHCTPSEDRSLDSNLHAQQQGLALRRSVSSERSFPQLQILNGKGAIQYDSDAIATASLRKAITFVRISIVTEYYH